MVREKQRLFERDQKKDCIRSKIEKKKTKNNGKKTNKRKLSKYNYGFCFGGFLGDATQKRIYGADISESDFRIKYISQWSSLFYNDAIVNQQLLNAFPYKNVQ